MATSDTDIVNAALILLGSRPIVDLNAGTDDITLTCRTLYDQARDWVLAEHPWNSCVKFVTLSKTATVSNTFYDFQYLYPADAVRVLLPSTDTYKWEVGIAGDQRVIWSDYDGLSVRYIFKNTNVNQYSPGLSWALSAYMAAVVAQALTQHRGKAQDRMLFYEQTVLPKAKAMDGQEQFPAEFVSTTLTDDVRLGG
jgi:hypothetical protein